MINVVIYARFSSHGQTEQSIEGQLKECNDFAARNKYKVIDTYVDRALTGTSDKRPEFQQMIEDSKKRHFQHILVYQLDRFARNRYDSATYKAKLQKNGVRVLSVRENITDDASGILVEGLLESMAEYFSAELSQKTIRGRKVSASKCKYLGGPIPFGYRIDENKMYQIDEKTSVYARKIFQMYRQDKPTVEILDYLNTAGVKTSKGGEWNKNSLHRILHNPKYIGKYTYMGITIEEGVPPMISFDEFDQVQKKLGGIKSHTAKTDDPFILTSKLYCGYCDSPIIGDSGTSKTGDKHYYYTCSGRKNKKNGCQKTTVPKKWLEDKIVDKTIEILSDNEKVDSIAASLVEFCKNDEDVKQMENYKAQKKDREKALSNLMKALEQGVNTKTTNNRINELEKEIESLDYEIRVLNSRTQITLNKELLAFWIKRMVERANDNRADFVYNFINKVLLFDDKILIAFNYSDENKNKATTVAEIKNTAELQEFDRTSNGTT